MKSSDYMGFRLAVNGDDSYGKCYGYNGETHLASLDYLISIDAFKHWNKESGCLDREDTLDYDLMERYFNYASSTPSITLTKEQFETFMQYYVGDISRLYNISDVNYTYPNVDVYVLEWY